MYENIQPGYQVHITSWENDADNYKTAVISGLSENEARYLIDVAHLLKMDRFGGSLSDEEFQELFLKIQAHQTLHADLDDEFKEKWFFDEIDHMHEILSALVSYSDDMGEYHDNYIRVCDSVKVYLVPSAIINVTKDFVCVLDWRDTTVLDFIEGKRGGFLWLSNNSVTVDQEFWDAVKKAQACINEGWSREDLFTTGILDRIERHAFKVFEALTEAAYFDEQNY